MSKTMKKVSALLLALLMIVTFMPMTQESAYAAAKKPGKVKGLKVKVSGKKMTISWKKAKNAKKYAVTIKDNTTKLKATKTTKKNKLKVTGQWSTKYSISVKGVNGKKKGKAAKKSATIGKNPADDKVSEEVKAAEKKVEEAQAKADQAKKEADEAKAAAEKAEADKQAAEQAKAQAEKDKENAEAKAEVMEKLAEELAKATIAAEKAKAEEKLKSAEFGVAQEELEAARQEYKDLDNLERMLLNDSTELKMDTWNPEVKDALNSMIKAHTGEDERNYVVFDFDNTCSIYDVEEQLAVYQLQKMAFAETMDVDTLDDVLRTGLDFVKYGEEYENWIHDITFAYGKLYETYGPFNPKGLDDDTLEEIYATKFWKQFATKMRKMYDLVGSNESVSVSYPWVLYWFTGMTHQEVYDLAYASHDYYRAVPTTYVTWTSPATGNGPNQILAKNNRAGQQSITWSSGTQVSQNIVELMAALDNAGIDVWVCSASATDPIRAAIDVFGLHDHVKGMMAMTNVYDDVFINEYDYATGYAWLPTDDGWVEATEFHATEDQTQGKGKVVAVQNVCGNIYGKGPIAGFMDSTGDFNFCTEFKDLEVVCDFNRASRKVTDGGGLVAEVACYQGDTGVTYETRPVIDEETGLKDVLYVLQGRDETGLRDLCNITDAEGENQGRATIRVTEDTEDVTVGNPPKVFANSDNIESYEYFKNKKLAVKNIMDTYCIVTAKDDPDNKLGFKYGFLDTYDGYKSQTGNILDGLKSKLELDSWNPEVKDALNSMLVANRNKDDKYVVFDFDNTCSIFDVEEQLGYYQLQRMAFAAEMDEDRLRYALAQGLDFDKYGAQYTAQIDDIAYAYDKLLRSEFAVKDDPEAEIGHFTPEGLDDEKSAAIQDTADWKEFATKMRNMYEIVGTNESVAVSYPWILYWFTGMSHEEVYNLAKNSHKEYKAVESAYYTLESPEDYKHGESDTEAGKQSVEITLGVAVSENINELMKALYDNGIDVWVCSASAIDPIRAAIDVWGLHPYVKGLMAMTTMYNTATNKFDLNPLAGGSSYDYEGHEWYPITLLDEGAESAGEWGNDSWIEGDHETGAQTQGFGKSDAIINVCGPQYNGAGPIAGFMDSTGDFNFCSEFDDLEVVCCFNRASRKCTDGGGLVAEVAVYENDPVEEDGLGYNYAKAKAAEDTLYVLQGRDETGLRSLRPSRKSVILGKSGEYLFRSDYKTDAHNDEQLAYFKENKLTVDYIMNTFCIKTAADDKDNPFTFGYGFLPEDQWRWYHGFVDPIDN